MIQKPLFEEVYFNNRNLMDFCVHASSTGSWIAADRDVSTENVPGRNGDLLIDNGRFKEKTIPYDSFIANDLDKNLPALMAFLSADSGYHELRDWYHPGVFVMARYAGGIDPDVVFNEAGSFTIEFSAHPEAWLDEGQNAIAIESSTVIFNPTSFTAKPLIRVISGAGTIAIGDISINILRNNGDLVIDCDLQDAKGANKENRNGDIELDQDRFFELPPGETGISVPSGMKIELVPRWWTIL